LLNNQLIYHFNRYSQEQLFDIVSNVDEYNKFLPACNKSQVIERRDNFVKATLEIGFPPLIVESYISHVTLDKPHLVRAQCFEGKLFEHLETEWKFSEAIKDNPKVSRLMLILFIANIVHLIDLYTRL